MFRMKIVYFYSHFAQHAGTERVLIDKMNYLSSLKGFEVVMLTHDQGIHPVAFPLSLKVKHVDLNVRLFSLYQDNKLVRLFKWRSRLRQLQKSYDNFIEKIHPDIVVTTTYSEELVKVVANSSYEVVRVLESHIDYRFLKSTNLLMAKDIFTRLYLYYRQKTLLRNARLFDLIVTLNKNDAEDWGHFLPTKIIPNVVSLNQCSIYSKHINKRAIFVGRYVNQKGIPDLFEIWKRVSMKYPDWYLDCYGDGELYDWMVNRVQQDSLRICIHHSTNRLFEHYCESSFLLMTSIYEPFGLVLPEAMSCGLPVVSFDNDGPRRIISHGKDGFIIKNRSIDDYVESVLKLIEDRDLCMQMGENAILSSQRFSQENIMPMWKELFESLVKK